MAERVPGVNADYDGYGVVRELRADLERVTKERDDLRVEVVSRHDAAAYMAQRGRADRAERELERVTKERDNLFKQAVTYGSDLKAVRRAWALWLLGGEWYDRDGLIHFTTSDSEGLPEDVRQLAMRYAGICIGPCADCKARAPLKQVCGATMNDPDKLVCAWGCSEKGASDGG